MSLAPGVRLGPYEIVGLIGAGGMGVVYRARDTRLGRSLAIKIVEKLSAGSFARTRLLREAQHASALNHPNVCTIYEIGEADGTPFIAMEFVEGTPLSEVIPSDGLPIEKVVRFGMQIADAVAHAHGKGIVHRDLKPSNIVITPQGLVKVLDFGLATRTWHEGAATAPTVQLTNPGTIAGTIAYMAPEVLQGKTADARSDIWSLGIILHELTTGGRPFNGRTEFELSSQILREAPPPLPARVPAGLSATVARCLMKDAAERYQQAGEIRAALEAPRAEVRPDPAVGRFAIRRGAALAALGMLTVLLAWLYFFAGQALSIKSIAVVPFVNVGGNSETEYLSDGITESIINSLAQLPQSRLKVIALNSVLRYKGRNIDAQATGRDLAVEAVVVGRVVQRPEVLSVTAELVNVSDRSRMWGETYNTRIAEVLAMQEDIATKISDNLRLRLNAEARKKLTKRYTDNVEAYDLYLKGRFQWNKTTETGWTKAIDYFHQALEVDPGYALAWAGMADSYYQLSSLVLLPSDAMPRARAASIRALQLDEGLAEAHASLGIVKLQYDWDRTGGEKELRRAIELNPSYATAHQWLGGYYYFNNGLLREALAELRRAQELDPLSPMIAAMAVWPLPPLGRQDEAIQQLQRAMEMHPDVLDLKAYYHQLRGERYLRQNMFDDAVGELVLGWDNNFLTGGGADVVAALTDAYRVSGIRGYWRKQLDLASAQHHRNELARQQSPARYVTPIKLAALYVRAGDTDQAFALLEQCYEHRDENLLSIKTESSMVDSPWWSVKSDPRFVDLMKRLGGS